MILDVPGVLTPAQIQEARGLLEKAEWVDGKVTAGHQSALAKNNSQIPEEHPVAKKLGQTIVESLGRHPLFLSAALPLRVFPPLVNRYSGGQSFGTHVDNAIRQIPGTPLKVRTDLSATLFFSDPGDYEGGELVVEDTYGVRQVKLEAGHLVLYPASSLHHVRPVTKGARVSSFFWIQSMVRSDAHRSLLFDLDLAIQQLNSERAGHSTAVALTGVYHNLLREWSEL
ncbi:MAG TPA: Fe2+-dependent dioxygenase [Thermoanaerobaculia bacterium]